MSGSFYEILERSHHEAVYLRQGSRKIARLQLESTDQPWAIYNVKPLAEEAFNAIAPIFTSTPSKGSPPSEIRRKLAMQLRDRIETIERSDLWLATEDGAVVAGEFLMHLLDGNLHIRSHQRGVVPAPFLKYGDQQ